MFKTYSSSSSLVITSRWFATSRLRAPVSVRLVYWTPESSVSVCSWCCMNFAIIIQWIYFTIWEKIKKNRHHYNTILSFYNIKTLQQEFAKKSNIPWIWRIIYGHKLPYMKKTRKKKQVCGAACFMAAEIKFSKDVRLLARKSIDAIGRFFQIWRAGVLRCPID